MNRRQIIAVSGGVAGAIGVGVALWLFRQMREHDIAQRAGECFLASDYRCLYALASPDERAAFGLSGSQLDGISAFAQRNGVGSLERRTAGVKNFFAPAGQGDYEFEVENERGKRLLLAFQVNRSKKGSYSPFTHALLKLHYVRVNQAGDLPFDGLSELAALREHIQKHAGEYQELGLMGHYSIKANGLVPFDEVAARYDRIEQQILAERQKSP